MSAARRLEQTFSALADPTRLAVVRLLGAAPRSAGDLAHELEHSAPSMSRHLRVLRNAGLVSSESTIEDARVRMYRLAPAGFEDLQGFAAELTAFWSDQLDAFRAHVGHRRRGRRGLRGRGRGRRRR